MTLSEKRVTQWYKSSHSGGGNDCVEIASVGVGTAVRDSKNPRGPILRFGSDGWTAFIGRARTDLSSS
ncbi:MAG TPA: DUF397 domain-containing protein [Pseudonocardiaceae bacterium]|nr:DUF397 domain-containing protein [Pseudonocardiaceae bacterium]